MEIKEKTQGSLLLNCKMLNWEHFAQPGCLTVIVALLLTVFLISLVKSGEIELSKLKNFYCIMQVCKNGDYQMLEMPMAKKDLALSLAEQYIVESNKYNNIYNLNNNNCSAKNSRGEEEILRKYFKQYHSEPVFTSQEPPP